jgi:hypothetical protein
MVYTKKITDPRLINNGQQWSQFLDNGNDRMQSSQTPPPTQGIAPQPTQPDWLVNRQNNPMSLQNSIAGGNGASAWSTKQTWLWNLSPKASNVAPINPIPKNTQTKPITNSSQAPLQWTTGNYAGSNGNLQSAIWKSQINPNQYTGSVTTQQAKQAMVGANNQYNQDVQGAITENAFNKADLDLANNQMRSTMKNADYVTKLTTGVQDQYRMGVQDPNQIAQNLWMSLDDVNKVVAWKGNEILQFSNEKMDELSKWYQRQTQDIDLQKKRALEDHDSTKARVDQKYQWNIDDMERDFWLANQLARKMGAWSGAVLSSGYQEGLKTMKDQFSRWLQRLTVNHDWDSEDMVKNKTRLLENIDINLDRLKYTHDNNIKNAKSSALWALQDLQSKYQISDTNMLKSLQSLESNYLANVNQIFGYDMKYMGQMMDTYNSEINRVNNLEQYNLNMEQKKQTFAMQQQQDYMQMYGSNPALAGAMFPTQQTNIERNVAIQKYWRTPAVRNFNPWNIMDTWFGGQKIAGERFTRFDSPQEWFNALVAKIKNIQAWNSRVYSPNMTLLQYISKYAPSADNNNPTAYAWQVAKQLWVSINTKVWQLDPVKLASAHAKHEDGNMYRLLLDTWVINSDWTIWNLNLWEVKNTKDQFIEQVGFMDKYGNFTTDPNNQLNISSTSKKIPNPDYQAFDQWQMQSNTPEMQRAQNIVMWNANISNIPKNIDRTKVAWLISQLQQNGYQSQNQTLNSNQSDIIQKRVDKFQSSDVWKNMNNVAPVLQWMNSNQDVSKRNQTNDISLIYKFAKMMDPSSSVKEWEYNSITSNSISALEKFGIDAQSIVNKKQILVPDARKKLMEEMQNTYNWYKSEYDKQAKAQGDQINRLANVSDWASWLYDFWWETSTGVWSTTQGSLWQQFIFPK